MALPWVRMDTQWPHNPKFLALIQDKKFKAITVYWASVAWSGAQGYNGFVPAYALPMIHGGKREASDLAEGGLWDPGAGGWEIHDWADYQISSEEHARRSERARVAAQKRWANQQ